MIFGTLKQVFVKTTTFLTQIKKNVSTKLKKSEQRFKERQLQFEKKSETVSKKW